MGECVLIGGWMWMIQRRIWSDEREDVEKVQSQDSDERSSRGAFSRRDEEVLKFCTSTTTFII